MTKPIEGWMAQAVHHPDLISRVFATAEEAAEHYQITEKTSQWKVRPVRITFTDEVNRVGDAVPEDERIADAIRKERERIWKAFNDLGYWPTKESEVYDCIFWEEK